MVGIRGGDYRYTHTEVVVQLEMHAMKFSMSLSMGSCSTVLEYCIWVLLQNSLRAWFSCSTVFEHGVLQYNSSEHLL